MEGGEDEYDTTRGGAAVGESGQALGLLFAELESGESSLHRFLSFSGTVS